MRCSLSLHLPRFWAHNSQFSGELRENLLTHLRECDSCRGASSILRLVESFRSVRNQLKKTSKCPESDYLDSLGSGTSGADVKEDVSLHVLTCPYCLGNINRKTLEIDQAAELLTSCLDEIHRAGREFGKEIATWLATEEYPTEKEVVPASFDRSYDRALHGSTMAASSPVPDLALSFGETSGSPSLSQQIIAVSVLVGSLRGRGVWPASAIADRLEQLQDNLVARGTNPEVLQVTLLRLRSL